jgi:hypothetical protein
MLRAKSKRAPPRSALAKRRTRGAAAVKGLHTLARVAGTAPPGALGMSLARAGCTYAEDPMCQRMFVVVGPALLAMSCAPTLVSGSMPNPAKTSQQLQSTQEYDIGPYKENHRYSVSITKWTPESVACEIKLVDDANCADISKYTFTLVDDKGARYAFEPAGQATQATEKGRADATLTATTLDGKFTAAIGADTKNMTVQVRSQKGVDCPALDFRWDLN